MLFDAVEWDENNLDDACPRVSAAEIEQVITNATHYRPHQRYPDRVLFTDRRRRQTGDHRRPLRPWTTQHPANHCMGAIMTEPGTAATDVALADYYDQHRDHPGWGEPRPAAKPQRLDVTISVRFTPAEIATIRTRAEAGGLKPTAYIRQCALNAEQPPIARTQLSRTVAALSRDLDDLRRTAS